MDTQLEDGYRFPPFYDSLMAKLIVRAHSRVAAVAAARSAAATVEINGVTTTLALHEFVLSHPDFIRGGVTTSWFGPTWEHRSEQRMASVR